MTIAVSWAEFASKPHQFVSDGEPIHITRSDGNNQVIMTESEVSAIQETSYIMSLDKDNELLNTIRNIKDGTSKEKPVAIDMQAMKKKLLDV